MFNAESVVKKALAQTLNVDDISSIRLNTSLKNDLHLEPMETLMFLIKLEELIDGFYVDPDTFRMSDLDTVSSIVSYANKQLVEARDLDSID
jgi:acyl carrier protein